MNKLFIFSFCIFGALALPSLKISPKGVVDGVKDCGSEAQVIQYRLTDEHNCVKTPCEIHPGHNYIIEIDFIPKYTDNIRLNTTLHQNGKFQQLSYGLAGTVEAGKSYTFKNTYTSVGYFHGPSEVKLELESNTNGRIEICALADIITDDH